MRRVEGEYLNYKEFETGDDVRRIVWQVYARNRELVVRTPEMFEPYASHLYYYVSFYSDIKSEWLNEGFINEMLNYFKNNAWTIYQSLAGKEVQLRFMPDQSFNVPEHLQDEERVAGIISQSVWQSDKPTDSYFNPRHGAVLCISSFISVESLKALLDRCDSFTLIYFVKLSRILSRNSVAGLISRIIFLPPQDRLSRLRAKWTFSPFRLSVQKREKEIEALLEDSKVT